MNLTIASRKNSTVLAESQHHRTQEKVAHKWEELVENQELL